MINKKHWHFEISERKILLRFFDVFFVVFILYFIGNHFDFSYLRISDQNFYWTLVLSVYLLFFGTVFEMYDLPTASNQTSILKSIVLTSSITVLVYLLTPFLTPSLPENRLQILLFYLAITTSLMGWRLVYANYLASHRFVKKALLICEETETSELINGLRKNDPHYIILGYVNLSKIYAKGTNHIVANISVNDLINYIKKNQISEIVVASSRSVGMPVEVYEKLLYLVEHGFSVREYSQVYEAITQRIPVQLAERDFYRYFPFSRNNQNQLYLIYVRIMEILISSIGLLIGIFIVPFILLGNLLGNQGPLLYKQERVGKNGKVFNIYKLRSMLVNAEKNGAVFATPNDVRITSFGKFLRKSRLDEVPQFINVLKNEMGIIGPRPERPVFVDQINDVMPFYQTRHVIKPGLTGWAQVNYSYGESLKDSLVKLQYDLYYIKHRGIFIDLNIMIKTISTVLFYRGQ
ncbi:sugar transferase [Flavobacterium columnare]|uniref:Glycosyl transferase n=2 Tax=Flavobacterium columnare TaxID=996 RepID=G8XAM7_FLACA|nr:exopolysaccharide biosynthesis polyprenyl glycosylphosphotransferase [Flavobacterium columnare]AEW87333.1 glycosyl transferase [Flavobacterium columnare ATCC 49512]AMO21196.1 exopolysaccharide biosynthesis polyprenyl glycosylphosphotransferase [Flavobacterium columnare]ANO48330.1 glycosyl transferase [Flavobacterium columnare]MBF6652548.1 sugar transferase [Flavobacterium columnare]MBF6655561.1 sugar transferase [Flavobacterium columnare]